MVRGNQKVYGTFLHKKSILRDEAIPTASSLLLGKAVCSNISTGTERLVATGNIPKELQETMKVPYQKGDFNFPVQYGYSMVLEIEERYYHLMHPHQDYCLISVGQSDPYPDRDGSESRLSNCKYGDCDQCGLGWKTNRN